jgi:hypothetical protein
MVELSRRAWNAAADSARDLRASASLERRMLLARRTRRRASRAASAAAARRAIMTMQTVMPMRQL